MTECRWPNDHEATSTAIALIEAMAGAVDLEDPTEDVFDLLIGDLDPGALLPAVVGVGAILLGQFSDDMQERLLGSMRRDLMALEADGITDWNRLKED